MKKICLQCDDGTLLVHGKRNLQFTYRDHTLKVTKVSGWHCPVCHDCQFDDETIQRSGGCILRERRSGDFR